MRPKNRQRGPHVARWSPGAVGALSSGTGSGACNCAALSTIAAFMPGPNDLFRIFQ